MKITNIISSITLLILISGCASKSVEENKTLINKNNNILNTSPKVQNIKIKKQIEIKEVKKLSSNEEEFLNILKNDKYASLCAQKNAYLNILNLENSDDMSEKIEELFYNYTKNLSNSCINQSAFKKKLKQRKYIDANQDYEVYNVDIDKEKLLNKFSLNKQSVDSILETYTPKHPQFFALIKELKNTSLSEKKLFKLRLNIERLKLLKYANNYNFIQLNIPTYNFAFYESGKKTKSFGTVVGAVDAQTPILSSKLAYFIVNPTWNIPDSIVKSSIIPKALKDKNYLRKKNIVIRKNYKFDSKKIKFNDVKWKKYLKKNAKYIPYKFTQLPSNRNGMGRMKFIFPNDYAVYMHDTIGTWRFKSNRQKIRFVSHGCIRLEHPVSLMKYLSTNYTKYSYKKVRGIYDSQRTSTVRLNKKLAIHLTYQTIQVNNGKLSFYNDIYGYDKIQKLNFTF